MNEDDMNFLSLKKLDIVDLSSHFNNEVRKAEKFFSYVIYDLFWMVIITVFDAGVLLMSALLFNGTNTFASGK